MFNTDDIITLSARLDKGFLENFCKILLYKIVRRVLAISAFALYTVSMDSHAENQLQNTLALLRTATQNSPYQDRLYLVGGLIRDRLLGVPHTNDLDIVLEGDAPELALFLHKKGVALHYPVTYPRFGTAMVHVGTPGTEGSVVELVSARSESYLPDSRKPDVQSGTLREDAFRRDFTLNTLMENLHTGEMLDLTGQGTTDLKNGVIRTPLEPRITFFDDPLRMLRAVRFAARFGFTIEEETCEAIRKEATRLAPPTISHERIHDEFVKIVKLPGSKARQGLEWLLELNLLEQFLPEMLPMVGCTQGNWHKWDVWTHTMVALEALPDDAPLETRLALLWHDIGKPSTRSEENGAIRFYGHPKVGAEMVRTIMNHLKFSNDEIRAVTALVNLHMRPGDYRSEWIDATVRRFIRDCHPHLEQLFILVECDRSTTNIPPSEAANLPELKARIAEQNALMDVARLISPLDGNEIMGILGIGSGATLKHAKDYLTNQVIEGRLRERDKAEAEAMLRDWWAEQGR